MRCPDWLALGLLCLCVPSCAGPTDRRAREIIELSDQAMTDVAANFRLSGHMAIFLIDAAGQADTVGPTRNLPRTIESASAYIDMAEPSPYTSPQYFKRGHVYGLSRTSDDKIIPGQWECQSLDSYQLFRASVFGPWSYCAIARRAELRYIAKEHESYHLAGDVSAGTVLSDLGLSTFPMFNVDDPLERDHVDIWIDIRDYYIRRVVITRLPGTVGGQPDPGGRLDLELDGFRNTLDLSVPQVDSANKCDGQGG